MDGVAVARQLRAKIQVEVMELRAEGITPRLAVILVGDHPPSQIYVRNKMRACAEVGIEARLHHLPGDIAETKFINLIHALNADAEIHGILVQLPPPGHVDSRRVLRSIVHQKDVDGFHLYNAGGLISGRTVFPPCTPFGVMNFWTGTRSPWLAVRPLSSAWG